MSVASRFTRLFAPEDLGLETTAQVSELISEILREQQRRDDEPTDAQVSAGVHLELLLIARERLIAKSDSIDAGDVRLAKNFAARIASRDAEIRRVTRAAGLAPARAPVQNPRSVVVQ